MKSTKCLVCGNDTLQGKLCAVCISGIPQIHEELIALLEEDKFQYVLGKLNLSARYKNISMN
jgi:hypothetical protein